jgi:N-acetylglucosaminyldiphosphoundecaprenol N-acetyl-beta-D-mannosaminyltransferase
VHVSKVNILGVGISPVNLADAVAMLEGWRKTGRRDYVCCVSVHGLVTSQRDPAIRSALNGAGLATKDGMPLVWWCRRAFASDQRRVCGSELLEAMCAMGVTEGHRHYFYGGSQQVIDQLVGRLSDRFPGLVIAGHKSPPYRALTQEEDCNKCSSARFRLGRPRNAQAGEVDGAARWTDSRGSTARCRCRFRLPRGQQAESP